MDNNEIKPKE